VPRSREIPACNKRKPPAWLLPYPGIKRTSRDSKCHPRVFCLFGLTDVQAGQALRENSGNPAIASAIPRVSAENSRIALAMHGFSFNSSPGGTSRTLGQGRRRASPPLPTSRSTGRWSVPVGRARRRPGRPPFQVPPGSTLARRAQQLEEHRGELLRVQSAQGQPHPGRSRDGAAGRAADAHLGVARTHLISLDKVVSRWFKPGTVSPCQDHPGIKDDKSEGRGCATRMTMCGPGRYGAQAVVRAPPFDPSWCNSAARLILSNTSWSTLRPALRSRR
jgi:hypothetical protein